MGMVEDLSSGLRQMRRNPGFAAAAIVTLALGIGATSAVFTLADPMVFRPLPYPDPDRLFVLTTTGAPGARLRFADYLRVRERPEGFEQVAEFRASEFPNAYDLDTGVLEALRIPPAVGRWFDPSDYRTEPQTPDVVLITWGTWQSSFGAREDILNQTAALRHASGDTRRFRIIGVLPESFVLPDVVNDSPGYFLPLQRNAASASEPNAAAAPLARLSDGVSPEQATEHLQQVITAVEREYSGFGQGRRARLVPLRDSLFGGIRVPLLMLLGATACVLLLACVNLAHLFTARLHSRTREFGVRLAIGGTRWRLTRQLAAESIVIAICGGAAAAVLGQWTFRAIMSLTPQFSHVYRLLPAGLDARVLTFVAGLAALALVVSAVVPAFSAASVDLRESLNDGGSSTASRTRRRLQRWLLAAQAAVAVALLITAGLIVGSFARLAALPLGFDPNGVTSVRIGLADLRRATLEGHRAVYEDVTGGLGIRAALAAGMPGQSLPARLGRADADRDDPTVVSFPVTGSFFDVFDLTLLGGRLFSDAEAFANSPVAVIDEVSAARLFPGRDALGQQTSGSDRATRTVVGVVRTVRTSLTGAMEGTAFVPLGAATRPWLVGMYTAAAAAPAAAVIQDAARRAYPSAEIAVAPLAVFEPQLGQPRFLAALLGALGLLTISLAVIGVYGIVAHQAARRTREVGIRIALGARREQIARMVLRDAFVPAALGVALGLGASLWWTETLRTVLHEVQPNDPLTYAVVAAGVLTIVVVASLRPALRAARADPVTTLRAE